MPALDGVVHLIAPAANGGAESVVRALALATRRNGSRRPAQVIALLTEPGAHPFVELLRADGVPVTEVRCGHRRYLAEVRRVERILRDSGATLLHTHVYHADVVGFIAAQRCGIPVVATVHGFSGRGWKNALYLWLDAQLLRRFDAVICVSEGVRARVVRSGVAADRAHLVPNGHAASTPLARPRARARLGLGEHASVLGWVGRLSREKGPDLFLDAVLGLAGPGLTAVLIGDGPERTALARRLARWTAGGCDVRLLGRHEDAGSLLAAFDVLVISSRSEGLPMVLLEAMAAEVPVVSFAVGGIPDAVSEAEAFLVQGGDTASLREAIRWVLGHSEDARRRSRAARDMLANRFAAERWLERVESVYRAARHA